MCEYQKVDGDITTQKMRDSEVPATLSVTWQNDKVRRIARLITCGKPTDEVTEGLPENLVKALVNSAWGMVDRHVKQSREQAAKRKKDDDAAVARGKDEVAKEAKKSDPQSKADSS